MTGGRHHPAGGDKAVAESTDRFLDKRKADQLRSTKMGRRDQALLLYEGPEEHERRPRLDFGARRLPPT
jgi:hypothetical protein